MEKCIICGKEMTKITVAHVKIHGITLAAYRQTLKNKVGVINEIKEKQLGELSKTVNLTENNKEYRKQTKKLRQKKHWWKLW